jgi:hypothetical protein
VARYWPKTLKRSVISKPNAETKLTFSRVYRRLSHLIITKSKSASKMLCVDRSISSPHLVQFTQADLLPEYSKCRCSSAHQPLSQAGTKTTTQCCAPDIGPSLCHVTGNLDIRLTGAGIRRTEPVNTEESHNGWVTHQGGLSAVNLRPFVGVDSKL